MLSSVNCFAFPFFYCWFAVAGLPVVVYFVRLPVIVCLVAVAWLPVVVYFVLLPVIIQLVAFLGFWLNSLFIWEVFAYCWLGSLFLLVWAASFLDVWVVARRLVVWVDGSYIVFVGVLGCSCIWLSAV